MNKYNDIIDLPHFHDPTRPYMSIHDRATQFAPYKSLAGYEEMVTTTTDEFLATDIRPATTDANIDTDPTPVIGT